MKKALLNPLFLCAIALALASCGSANSPKPAGTANARTSCPSDLFIEATGTGETLDEASANAKVKMAGKIISQVKSKVEIEKSKAKDSEGRITPSSKFSTKSQIESDFTLLGINEMESRQLENGEYEYKGYVCNSNVARPYLKSLQNYRDSLKVLKRQKMNKDVCDKAIEIRENMRGFEIILEVLEQADKSLQKEYENIYAEIENDCGLEAGKKIHWNPEKQTAYSDIAFSKLSKSVEMETSPCKGKGISLVYIEDEKCADYAMGVKCTLNPSLAIQSCKGEKYSMLKAEPITGSSSHNKNKAKEELLKNFSKSDFFNEWEKKIMEVMPECSK